MKSLRIFLFGGPKSFRALFIWGHPAVYVPTLLGYPLFQVMFYTYLGRFTDVADDRFFVVGNAVQASVLVSVTGMIMLLTNERDFGTLSAIFVTPANRLAMFFGRTLPLIAHGLVVSAFGFGVGSLILGVHLSWTALPSLVATVVLAIASCTMVGLVVGAIALRARDLWVSSNLANSLLLLLCGVNFPLSALPGWVAAVGWALPLTYGIQAARRVADGASLVDVSGLIAHQVLLALAYGAVGYGLLRFFEAESRRRATLGLV